jgi:hypothetical protein
MELLTAVNLILPKLGEHTVTSTSAKHPTLGIILPMIEMKQRQLLTRGWWFNTQKTVTLYPDSTGMIARPFDLLELQTADGPVALRKEYLWNTETGTFVFTQPIVGTGVYFVEFWDMPEEAALYVVYSAAVEAYLTDIGREAVVQEWKELEARAWADLQMHHLRQKRHTTRTNPRFQKLRAAMRG